MMTFLNTPIEMQLQRNSSIILKQKNIREYLPPESTKMLRKFEVFRNNSLVQKKLEDSDIYSLIKVRRHSSELLLGRSRTNNHKLPVIIQYLYMKAYKISTKNVIKLYTQDFA